MESANVKQIVEDFNYINRNLDQMPHDLMATHIIALLDLAYSIGMIEGDVEDDKSNG